MLPGFVDAHSHFSAMMQMASGLDLDDPSRPPVTDVASLQAAIRSFIDARSEENTSELQSLMRISYAVFCLKKKINITQTNSNHRFETTQKTKNLTALQQTNIIKIT